MSEGEATEAGRTPTLLRSSAVMAAGTVVSRMSGYLRSILLAAALGGLLHADIFTIANTVPNMLYILLVGGVVNAVLVPQLVRAATNDVDGGQAYTDRIVTLAGSLLFTVTVVLVVAAPWVMKLFLDGDVPPQGVEAIGDLARYCLPQVFFYGMYVLMGQILNARGSFGPMMWAPIANNVVSIAMLATYLVVFGADDPRSPGYTAGREALLGIGSTLGIALQFAILIPFLARAGVRIRPRFDWLHSGLGHTLRLGGWTVLFVIVNQIAYTVVVRLASSGTAGQDPDGTGVTIYTSTFLIMMVPHSIITVSLATAALPSMSRRADVGDRVGVGSVLSDALRTALVVVVPFAALLPVIAPALAQLLFGYGAAADYVDNYVPSLALWGAGLAAFTIHFVTLRGFYALEQNRVVFWIQCAVAATNIGVAVVLVGVTDAKWTVPALIGAYTAAYTVGAVVSTTVLRRRLTSIGSEWGGFVMRLGFAALVSAGAAAGARWALEALGLGMGGDPSKLAAFGQLGLFGLVAVSIYLLLARILRLDDVTAVVSTVFRRSRRRISA